MTSAKSAMRFGTRCVLLVDDEPPYLSALARSVAKRSGIDVTTCPSALCALTELEARHFDLVVSDLQMRGLDGRALLEHVGQRWPKTRRLLLTGHSSGEMVAQAPYPVLDKLIDREHIIDTIVRLARS